MYCQTYHSSVHRNTIFIFIKIQIQIDTNQDDFPLQCFLKNNDNSDTKLKCVRTIETVKKISFFFTFANYFPNCCRF